MSKKRPPLIRIVLGLIAGVLIGQYFTNPKPVKIEPSSTKTTPKTYAPPSYDVDGWQSSPKKGTDDIQAILAIAGVGAVADTGLDFDGLPAELYRYHGSTDAPFVVAVSDKYIEINWYFANAKDDEQYKARSQDYTKKAYQMTTMMIGDVAKPIFSTILQGKKSTDRAVANAECKNYQCGVVVVR